MFVWFGHLDTVYGEEMSVLVLELSITNINSEMKYFINSWYCGLVVMFELHLENMEGIYTRWNQNLVL